MHNISPFLISNFLAAFVKFYGIKYSSYTSEKTKLEKMVLFK